MSTVFLASESPVRLQLLQSVGIEPVVCASEISEHPTKGELPRKYVERLALEKAITASKNIENGYIIGAHTAVTLGRRILPKATSDALVKSCLTIISGRRHTVYTGLYVIRKTASNLSESRSRIVSSIVRFKSLTIAEIEFYVQSKEGIGRHGGYSLGGRIESFIPFISGSTSNIAGIPMVEFKNLMTSLGYSF